MKKYSFLITLLTACTIFSQQYKGMLNPIENNGLHKIQLPNNVRAACHDNFSSLRIKDSQDQEVPYVLIYNTDRTFSKFIATEIISKKVIKDSVTSIIVKNKKDEKLENIILKIANTNITKNYNVFGSNDNEKWFGLIANKRLSYLNKTNSTVLEKTINFPLNNYSFLRIDFNDKNSLPINILEAGFYKNEFFTQQPIEIKNYTYTQENLKDKKVTQLKFSADKAHKIDLISFAIKTNFFLRNVKIITAKTRKIKKQTETYLVTLDVLKLNSNYQNTFYVNNINEKEFTIEIDNQDNPPLAIENISLLQKPVYLIANLKQKEPYNIIIDDALNKPSYDLGNFISNKITNINKATVTNFSELKNKTANLVEPKKFWQTKLFMWICILIGGALVIYFSLSLIKDINKK